MSNVAVLPPLRPNKTKNSKHDANVAASVSIPKPQLLAAKSPRRKSNNHSATEFDKPEYLVQQWNQLKHDIGSLKMVVGPLQQESDDLQVRCERMSYTPEMRELAAQADQESQTKKQLDDDLATIRRTFTPEIYKKLTNEISDLKGRFHYHSEKLDEVENEINTKNTSLSEILQSDSVLEMEEQQQNIVALRKRLRELKNENENLESDLELKLNDLAADPVENKQITGMKRRLRQEQRDTNKKRNQLNLMRKEFENKKFDLNEKIEKKQKEKKAKITSRNWRQNLNIPEPVDEDEGNDNILCSDNYDTSYTENTGELNNDTENASQYSSSMYEYDENADNLLEAADQESNSKSDNTRHHNNESSDSEKSNKTAKTNKTEKTDDSNEKDIENFDNYENTNDKDHETNELNISNETSETKDGKEISGRLRSESGEFRYILPLNENPEIKFEHRVLLDVGPSLDFDYSATYSSECIMSKSTPASSTINMIQQPMNLNDDNKASTTGINSSQQTDQQFSHASSPDLNNNNFNNKTNDTTTTDEMSDEQIQHQEAVKYVQEIYTEEALSDEEAEYTLSEEEKLKQNEEEYFDEAQLDEEVELEYKENEKIKDMESESTDASHIEMNNAANEEEEEENESLKRQQDNECDNENMENDKESESGTESGDSEKLKKFSFSRAQKSQIVADIQPCSLYLKLAQNVEKFGDDINFDDFL